MRIDLMVFIEKGDRDIFILIINYRYSSAMEQNNFRFLLAHVAEHMIVVNVCRKLKQICGEKIGIEKFISGLTNVEYTSIQLTASNHYLLYVIEFLNSVQDHNLMYISEADLEEQKKNVLSEYAYAADSFQGRCNLAFDLLNGFEKIDVSYELEKITMETIESFVEQFFTKERCTITYVGKHISELQKMLSCYFEGRRNYFSDCVLNRNLPQINIDSPKNTEVWFGYCRNPVKSIYELYENEIISKAFQFLLMLNNSTSGNKLIIKKVGCHYSERCSYALYYANSYPEIMKFEGSWGNVAWLLESVIQEYTVRISIKLDSIIELGKYVNKVYLLTGESYNNVDSYIEKIGLLNIKNLSRDLKALFYENNFLKIYYRTTKE